MEGGWTMMVFQGTHWLAHDPLVLRRPELFTDDWRTGICHSVPLESLTEPMEELRG